MHKSTPVAECPPRLATIAEGNSDSRWQVSTSCAQHEKMANETKVISQQNASFPRRRRSIGGSVKEEEQEQVAVVEDDDKPSSCTSQLIHAPSFEVNQQSDVTLNRCWDGTDLFKRTTSTHIGSPKTVRFSHSRIPLLPSTKELRHRALTA